MSDRRAPEVNTEARINSAIGTVLRDIFRDLTGFVGAGLLAYGGWLHYPPLGFMIGGGALFSLAIVATLKS